MFDGNGPAKRIIKREKNIELVLRVYSTHQICLYSSLIGSTPQSDSIVVVYVGRWIYVARDDAKLILQYFFP